MDLTVKAAKAIISSDRYSAGVEIEIESVDEGELLHALSVKDCIKHFGEDAFLDEIGKSSAIEHFQIEEKEEE